MGDLTFKVASRLHSGVYRLSGGKAGGRIGALDVLLLTTTGRKSGKQRTVPLLYTSDGDGLVVIGSKGGTPENPGWCLNLSADPHATVTIGRETRHVEARIAEGEERERLWRRMADAYPAYDGYQTKTSRRIPVVVLEPASADRAD
jgi:deazaflavin-dependent oxidoreductase (nitroreductase family)